MDRLDNILKTRTVPEVPAGLSARIVARAAEMPQGARAPGVFDVLRAVAAEIQSMMTLPQPSYALAGLLVFGLVIGAVVDGSSILPGIVTSDLASVLLIEDSFVASEFIDAGWS